MPFNSLAFALFFVATLAVYASMPLARRWMVLLVASYVFVFLADSTAPLFVAFATLAAYGAAILVERRQRGRARTTILVAALLTLVGTLIATKYARFLGATLTGSFGFPVPPLQGALAEWVIPLGISFWTLRLVGYLLDVNAGRIPAQRNFGVLALYAAFFAEFTAGPIDRAGALVPQLLAPRAFDYGDITRGLKRFAWGLFKKAVVADQIGQFVDPAYASPASFPGITLAIASVLYAFQVFYDFSGYSDMAIGIGEVMGLRLAKNFERPYHAQSVSEFWRRWHISLSTWLRDYLFLPLAYSTGRRLDASGRLSAASVDQASYAIATMTTMLVAGLWHGAGWTFVAWGGLIGGYMVVSRLTKKPRARLVRALGLNRAPGFYALWRVLSVFALLDLGWVFFRARGLADAFYILGHLGQGAGTAASTILAHGPGGLRGFLVQQALLVGTSPYALVKALAGIGIVESFHFLDRHGDFYRGFMAKPVVIRWAFYYAVVAVILLFGVFESRGFIYAQF